MLGVGCFIAIVSFIAYFGAHIEHAGFLKTYSSTIALMLVMEIILVGLVYAHRKELDDYGSKAWDFFSAHDDRLLLDIEQSLHCCGYAGPTDRPIMKCPSSLHHGQELSGCKDAVVNTVYQWREGILAIILVLLAIKLTALLTAVVLTVMVERDAEEEREYMAVLSAQNNNHSWYDSSGGPSNIASSSAAGGSSSPVFGRQLPPYSSSPSRTGFFYSPRPPSYQQHNSSRIPRYGSTLSTSSHK